MTTRTAPWTEPTGHSGRGTGTAIPAWYPAARGRVLRILARWEESLREGGPRRIETGEWLPVGPGGPGR